MVTKVQLGKKCCYPSCGESIWQWRYLCIYIAMMYLWREERNNYTFPFIRSIKLNGFDDRNLTDMREKKNYHRNSFIWIWLAVREITIETRCTMETEQSRQSHNRGSKRWFSQGLELNVHSSLTFSRSSLIYCITKYWIWHQERKFSWTRCWRRKWIVKNLQYST